jgi:Fic family protein
VRDTARSAIDQSQAILNLRDAFRQKLAKHHRALTLVDDLFVNPYTTVARAAGSLGVTAPTASKTIRELERAGILKEVTGREWGRCWLAKPILEAVEAPPERRPGGGGT